MSRPIGPAVAPCDVDDPDTLDDKAFADFYARHRTALRRYIYARTRDRQRAEDLVQEVFAKAYAGRARFDRTRPFWPWVTSIAARECIDAHRRRTYAEARLAELARFAPRDPFDTTTASVIGTLESETLARELERLPVRQRIALQLVALDGWSYAEVAEHFGYSVAMVKALIVRARRKLRDVTAGTLGAAHSIGRWWRQVSARLHPDLVALPSSSPLGGALPAAIARHLPVVAAVMALLWAPSAPQLGDAPAVRKSASPGTAIATVALEAGPVPPSQEARRSASFGPSQRPPLGDVEGKADDAIEAAVPASDDDLDPTRFQVSSFHASPAYDEDQTVFMTGTEPSLRAALGNSLFASRDGGASWARLGGKGLGSAARLLFPPSYPADSRIFAVTDKGLQVSTDGGAGFETLAVLPGLHSPFLDLRSIAAISPRFDRGDPSILVAAGSLLWGYRGDTGLVEPVDLGVALAGHRVTSVAYPSGSTSDVDVFVGTVSPEQTLGAAGHYVSRCSFGRAAAGVVRSRLECEPVRLPRVTGLAVPLRVPADSDVLYVPHPQQPFVSFDAGRTFSPMSAFPGGGAYLKDLATVPSSIGGSAVAAQLGSVEMDATGVLRSGPQLARTDDGGRTWQPLFVDVPGFAMPSTVMVTPTGRILAASESGGIACSENGGRTWARTCPTADAA